MSARLSTYPGKAVFDANQRELYRLMRGISARSFFAGWKDGLEFLLWRAIQTGDLRISRIAIYADDLARCAELAALIDGWIVWVDDENDPGLPTDDWGPRVVPMSVWLSMYCPDPSCIQTPPA